MKTDLFQSCGHCWIFQICWHIECGTFTASSFRNGNSSTGIPSLPLALFIVMLPKAYLTLHSRYLAVGEWSHHHDIWVIKIFLVEFFCVFFLFLISSVSVRFIPFHSFIVPIFAWNVPLVSLIFLMRSLVFPILLFPSIFLHWSLGKAFWSLLAIFWNATFRWIYLSFFPLPFASLHFSAICKASSDSHFAFSHFFFLGMVLIITFCTI